MDCLYWAGTCEHDECSGLFQPEPTAEEYCAGYGHKRLEDYSSCWCWCGEVWYSWEEIEDE